MTDLRARELLRQEREAFDQAKAHNARWFSLRLTMGYTAIGFLFVIAIVSSYMLVWPERYTPATIGIAAATLLVDVLGLVVSICKLILEQSYAVPIRPTVEAQSDKL